MSGIADDIKQFFRFVRNKLTPLGSLNALFAVILVLFIAADSLFSALIDAGTFLVRIVVTVFSDKAPLTSQIVDPDSTPGYMYLLAIVGFLLICFSLVALFEKKKLWPDQDLEDSSDD